MDLRLQRRYWRLVREHMNANPNLAAGPKAMQDQTQSFASTQALWRFLANEKVTLPQLAVPLRAYGRQTLADNTSGYALLVHDWSKVSYGASAVKADQTQLTHRDDVGYELYTALLVSADNGQSIAPLVLELLAADGVHSTQQAKLGKRVAHLQQLFPSMQASRTWDLPTRLVHVIDREADATAHFRQWDVEGELFLVRADFTRKVDWQGKSYRLPDLVRQLEDQQRFREAGEVAIHGRRGLRQVATAEIALSRPARMRTSQGRRKLPGPPLCLRLVVSRVFSEEGDILAEWYLLSNVPSDVSAETLADWYYWRWRIESFHKLLKSGGQQLESWQQHSAHAVAKRLLVAAMVCVTAWDLERQTSETAAECRQFLVRLSGRQMKRNRPETTSALVAGLMILLPLTELLNQYTPEQLHQLARTAAPMLIRSG